MCGSRSSHESLHVLAGEAEPGEVLNQAKSQEVLIRRRGGETFRVTAAPRVRSPLDVEGSRTETRTANILDAIRDVRER